MARMTVHVATEHGSIARAEEEGEAREGPERRPGRHAVAGGFDEGAKGLPAAELPRFGPPLWRPFPAAAPAAGPPRGRRTGCLRWRGLEDGDLRRARRPGPARALDASRNLPAAAGRPTGAGRTRRATTAGLRSRAPDGCKGRDTRSGGRRGSRSARRSRSGPPEHRNPPLRCRGSGDRIRSRRRESVSTSASGAGEPLPVEGSAARLGYSIGRFDEFDAGHSPTYYLVS